MICPKCGGDTFIMVSDVGLKCENCGYVYSIEGKMKKQTIEVSNLKLSPYDNDFYSFDIY